MKKMTTIAVLVAALVLISCGKESGKESGKGSGKESGMESGKESGMEKAVTFCSDEIQNLTREIMELEKAVPDTPSEQLNRDKLIQRIAMEEQIITKKKELASKVKPELSSKGGMCVIFPDENEKKLIGGPPITNGLIQRDIINWNSKLESDKKELASRNE